MEIVFEKPAILLGNGLNLHSKCGESWQDLLNELAGSKKNSKQNEKIENLKGITYPEFFNLICLKSDNLLKEHMKMKRLVSERISMWKQSECHKKFVEFARENEIPVITTNYDTNLVLEDFLQHTSRKTESTKKKYKPRIIKEKSFTDFYPWSSYYSDKNIESATDNFAVWHMHGIWVYKRSLVIGTTDYTSVINRARSFLYSKNFKRYFFSDDNDWKGKNTWLDIFFHNDLYIIGLSLDSCEADIRWLLMEREKFFLRNKDKRRKTLFVYTNEKDEKSFPAGKKFFFDSIQIDVKQLSYAEIYDSWKRI